MKKENIKELKNSKKNKQKTQKNEQNSSILNDNKKKLGIYVHIPFCEKKCDYCDFVSFCAPQKDKIEYVNALVQEICFQSQNYKDFEIDTIFVGGGTPSCLPDGAIYKIMWAIYKNYNVLKNAEITIECNPNSITIAKLKEFRESKINRLSIGLQSSNNKLLKLIGRLHNKKDYVTAISRAKLFGFKNINTDIIVGIPKQKMHHINSELRFLKKQNINHISAYSLIVEDETPLKKNLESGVYKLPSEEKSAKMFQKVSKFLQKNGYFRYEVSNFAKKGYESKHNLKYWTNQNYLGLGLHASSFVDGKRWKNIDSLNDYIEKANKNIDTKEEVEVVDENSQIEECVMLALRTNTGINLADFQKRFGYDLCAKKQEQIDDLISQKLLIKTPTNIVCTEKGFDFLNQIILKLID